ncbi:Uncharacterized protein FWK35_00016689 [Aphis craccivora]|uniref:DUF8207 domain-containing protein n=1 Tax=Aphis craccivora TaxID=307492 RepID=A0A6G0Y2A2_APHCR|nr:Uncharacterized protein FWK35_00016689 [Aphis craccivora]
MNRKKPSKHGLLLPYSIRAILVGPSGSGKTNIMYNLITHENGKSFVGKFNNLKKKKGKIMEMKRGIIESDNYFCEAFKPLIEPLINQTEKNTQCNTQPADEIKSETSDLFNKYYPWTEGLWSLLCEKEPKNTTLQDMKCYYDILKTSRVHLKADGKPKTSKFHKWTNVVKSLYDRMKNEEKQLNKEIDKINNSRTPRLTPKCDDYYVIQHYKTSVIKDISSLERWKHSEASVKLYTYNTYPADNEISNKINELIRSILNRCSSDPKRKIVKDSKK